jgi:hypothetical protein
MLKKEFHDPVLGTLRLAEENWWEASVAIDGRTLGFKIGGKIEPDSALIAHARDIVRSFPEFEKMVAEFLTSEAKGMPSAADEIGQLVIEDVMLCWPKRPDDGMIYFKGPEQYRLWRCDYVGRKPRGLGFDN